MEGGGGPPRHQGHQGHQGGHQGGQFFHQPRLPYYQIKPNYYTNHHRRGHGHHRHQDHGPTNATNFDQKRMKNNLQRRTVDYNTSVIKYLQSRIWQRDYNDARMVQPDHSYIGNLSLPHQMLDNPINAVTTRFVRTSTNKVRCPIFCVVWTPEGRRLVTGASSGEFTLWNGLTFNFETILQAHECAVRTMTWSRNDMWLLTGDDQGFIKYWQSNMNNVQMYQAHKDQAVRCASFAPLDTKFCTCSDDGTVRIWDFLRCHEEKILRGHGADVRCVDWHPSKSIVVSGSKDSQQPVKLWDSRTGEALCTLHAHKSTVMSAKWNMNGNWLLTASRDHLVKLFDIRMMKELFTFRGHKKEATAIAWHPIHEDMFVSGGSDGGILFWQVGHDKEIGGIEEAHESIIWGLAWHPLGHMLCSGSNDHSTKFWTRNRPGDKMRDRYNLNTLPIGTSEDLLEFDDDTTSLPVIPGMGLEYGVADHLKKDEPVPMPAQEESLDTSIPGLDSSLEELERLKPKPQRKVPYARPVPQTFLDEWEANKAPGVAPNIEEDRRKKREEDEKRKREEEAKKKAEDVKKRAEEMKKRKEEELKRKIEKPELFGLMNIPDFGGQPEIWIVGDSVIHRTKERAAETNRLQLGTPYNIQWQGQGDARLEDVKRLVDNRLSFAAPPSVVIIHLGSNNIGQIDALRCRARIEEAFSLLRTRMPQTQILWSSIIPRRFYDGKRSTDSTSQKALDGVRLSLNKFARRQAKGVRNASVIKHDIKRINTNFFVRGSIHLSDQGMDVLILNFENAVKEAITG